VKLVVKDRRFAEAPGKNDGDLFNEVALLSSEGESDAEAFGTHLGSEAAGGIAGRQV
jgi:hypothetical protein